MVAKCCREWDKLSVWRCGYLGMMQTKQFSFIKFITIFSSFREIDGANYIVFCKSLLKLIQVITIFFLFMLTIRSRKTKF